MPQFGYGRQPRLQLGQVHSMDPIAVDSYLNPLEEQIDTIAFAGDGDGDFELEIEGEEVRTTIDVTAAAATAALFVAAIDADPSLDNVVTAADVGGDLVLTYQTPGRAYATRILSNPGTQLTLTATQAAGGPSLPLGVAVAFGADGETEVASVGPATLAANIAGVTVRNEAIEFNRGNTGGFQGDDEFVAGETVSVGRLGEFVVRVEDAVAAGAACFVRIATPPADSVFGAFRSDTAGGAAIVLPSARFRTSTDGAGLAVISIGLP